MLLISLAFIGGTILILTMIGRLAWRRYQDHEYYLNGGTIESGQLTENQLPTLLSHQTNPEPLVITGWSTFWWYLFYAWAQPGVTPLNARKKQKSSYVMALLPQNAPSLAELGIEQRRWTEVDQQQRDVQPIRDSQVLTRRPDPAWAVTTLPDIPAVKLSVPVLPGSATPVEKKPLVLSDPEECTDVSCIVYPVAPIELEALAQKDWAEFYNTMQRLLQIVLVHYKKYGRIARDTSTLAEGLVYTASELKEHEDIQEIKLNKKEYTYLCGSGGILWLAGCLREVDDPTNNGKKVVCNPDAYQDLSDFLQGYALHFLHKQEQQNPA